jgi:hypothetical protein
MAKRRKTRELQREKKLAEDNPKSQSNKLKNMHTYIEKECIQRYGFISNSKQTPWQNKINALKMINPDMLDLKQPSNLAFHNLSDSELPTGTQRLLGLSLKFCLQQGRPTPAIEETIRKMQRSIRIQHWISELQIGEETDNNYIPGLYLPSDWTPPLATPSIERRLLHFENELRKEVKRRKPCRSSNLDFFQNRALKILRNRTDLHISNSDKNLGPVVRTKRKYMEGMFRNHLDTKAYKQLTKDEADAFNQETRSIIKKTMHPQCGASKAILTYFNRSLKQPKRNAHAYGLPKLHKNPIVDRPIISGINNITEVISKIADYFMKQIIPSTPTHLKDSQTLIKEIKEIGQLPPHAKLFTADATAMYTNIQPDVGIEAIAGWIQAYPQTVPKDIPQGLLLQLLDIIMRRNVFSFDDTNWLQTIGTAMGTPCACSYATLSYAFHEIQQILTEFSNFLLILKRFIDDMFGIWIDGPGKKWEQFKKALEGFGQLKWICSSLTDSVTFLDLTITINKQGTIETTTYIKPKNLHLYIPAMSAHPPGCLKGTIFGNLIRYWNQNSNISDYKSLVQAFSKHLQARGHNITEIDRTMLDAATHIENKSTEQANGPNKTTLTSAKTLFIHWQYHQYDINRTVLRRLYDETLKGFDGFDAMTVCYSRPKNLRDILTNTVLEQPPDEKMSEIVESMKTRTQERKINP